HLHELPGRFGFFAGEGGDHIGLHEIHELHGRSPDVAVHSELRAMTRPAYQVTSLGTLADPGL
ncbi:MAG: hypothetical protein KDB53_08815, partial [Planctomycetes bacterium]|nr:hypothetical protein [Planctomycetota bacterium]